MAGHVISPEFNAGEHTDAAALIGTAAPAIKSMAEPIYEELGLVRIQRWQGEGTRWPDLGTASTLVVAGARPGSATRYRAPLDERMSDTCSWIRAELGDALRHDACAL